jgi:hypothetical protein
MKLFSTFLLVLLISSPSLACKKSVQKQVKKTIVKMFKIVEAGHSNKLANYIVYRGDDVDRKWKDHCNYDIPEEKNQVQNIHQRIVDRYLPYQYEFVKFITQKELEGEWLVWEMKFFTKDKEPKKVFFAFLKVDGQYLLGDID